jgi:two-component system chemotaxis response regulator CheY
MLRSLVVEDELTNRKVLEAILSPLGACDVAVNGGEALEAFAASFKSGRRYQLVCLDITMPDMDGHTVLRRMRELERAAGVAAPARVKVIMTSASGDPKDISGAFREECDAYIIKPIGKSALMWKLASLGLQA